MTLQRRSRVRPVDPAYSTGACDDPSIGGSPEHSRAVDDARPRWTAGTPNADDVDAGLGPFKWVRYDDAWQVIERGFTSTIDDAVAKARA